MPSEGPHPPDPPAPHADGHERRPPPDRSTSAAADQAEVNHAPSSLAPAMLNRASPQRGSSREMTPPGSSGSIKYTRTGRVSKASKGQRVHHCEECGKTYTRAEHLRRHQQNHKPGAFPCDIPDCGRSFYREDLLTRHKARHDEPDDSPSPPQFRTGHDFYPAHDRQPDGASRATPAQLPSTRGETTVVIAGGSSAPSTAPVRSQRNPKGYAEPHQHTINLPVAADGASDPCDITADGAFWDLSPPFSPMRYDSPTNNDFAYANTEMPYYNHPQPNGPQQASHPSYFGYGALHQASNTPESAGSSTVCLSQWAYNAQDHRASLYNSSDSEVSYAAGIGGGYNSVMADHALLPGAFGSSQLLTATERDLGERDDLAIPAGPPHDSVIDLRLNEPTCSNEDRYLDSYWLWTHPLFPVVHRPSFNLREASPLLKAAMLALGAHALGDATDKTNARIVHERCMKVLKKRTLNDWHTFRLSDMQAIVLVEVYSIFRSRRPPLQFSKAFEDAYRCLTNDHEASNPLPTEAGLQGPSTHRQRVEDDRSNTIGILCKQRLIAACYILDSQHATLFGRRRTSCFPGTGIDLPFPTSQVSWDGQRRPPQRLEPHDRVWQALDGGNMDEPAQQRPHDVFQSTLMMACLTDSPPEGDEFYPTDPSKDLAPVLGALHQSAQIKLAYNTLMLCKHTPIRDLLAVAGESWVMAEKLSTQADYTASHIEARNWASAAEYPSDFQDAAENNEQQQAPVQKAVRHALQIVKLHMNHPKTGLPFQEWSVYLAAVVVWAYSHISSLATQRPRLSVPNPSPPSLAPWEIERSVTAIASMTDKTVAIDEEGARRVLLWAKAAIEKVDLPHNCGLTNGALDVLGKLVTRGLERGWFGL